MSQGLLNQVVGSLLTRISVGTKGSKTVKVFLTYLLENLTI